MLHVNSHLSMFNKTEGKQGWKKEQKGIFDVNASFVRNVSQTKLITRKSSKVANDRQCCTSNGAISLVDFS